MFANADIAAVLVLLLVDPTHPSFCIEDRRGRDGLALSPAASQLRQSFLQHPIRSVSRSYTRRARAMPSASDETMRKYYRTELDTAKTRVDAAVGKTLILQATGGPEGNWREAEMPMMRATWSWVRRRWLLTRCGSRRLP